MEDMERVFHTTFRETASLSRGVHERLDNALELGRQLYNAALQERIECYQKTGGGIGLYDQYKSLTLVRSDDPAYRALHVGLMRSVLERVEEGFKHFFRRVGAADARPGFPRFKGGRRGLRSLSTTGFSVCHSGRRLSVHIKGIGRFVVKRMPPRESIRLLRIVKTPLRVVLHFCCEKTIDVVPCDSEPVGIDVGVAKQATLSTGEALSKRVPNTRRMKRLQRKLSRAKRGSRNREKKRLAYAKECERLSERERQHVHRITTEIVRECPNLVVEDLEIANMTASAKGTAGKPGRNVRQKAGLNRSILEQYWGYFVQLLTYKAERAGGSVERVPPHNTSKACSSCGWRHPNLTLEKRVFLCHECGLNLDRDHNAAINIRNRSALWLPGGNASPEAPGMRPDGESCISPVAVGGA